LSDAIAAWSPQHGVAVWWLGQAGFVLRGAAATVVIDPFVTDFGSFGRLYEPPLEPEDLDKVDLLLGTHDHADHIDPLGFPRILAASPGAAAVVLRPSVNASSNSSGAPSACSARRSAP